MAAKKSTVRDINRFIFEVSSQVLVQSEKHLREIQSAPEARLYSNARHKALVFALSDAAIPWREEYASASGAVLG